MKVELSIKDDNELRNYIKDMIKGQVTSILRNEIGQFTVEAYRNEKIDSIAKRIEKKLEEHKEEVEQEIREQRKGLKATFKKSSMKTEIRSVIKEEVRNYDIASFIENEVVAIVKTEMAYFLKNKQ